MRGILSQEENQNNNHRKNQAVPEKDFVTYALDEF